MGHVIAPAGKAIEQSSAVLSRETRPELDQQLSFLLRFQILPNVSPPLCVHRQFRTRIASLSKPRSFEVRQRGFPFESFLRSSSRKMVCALAGISNEKPSVCWIFRLRSPPANAPCLPRNRDLRISPRRCERFGNGARLIPITNFEKTVLRPRPSEQLIELLLSDAPQTDGTFSRGENGHTR